MNWKTSLLLLVALLAGGAAALGVKSVFFVEAESTTEEVVAGLGETTPILVANVDLPAGSELTAQNVRLTLASEEQIPREPTLTFSDAVGEITTRDLKAGEPISLFDVAVAEEIATPAISYVKPGYSIVPIEIQTATKGGGSRDFLKSTKLAKILKPGDVVDLEVVKEDKSAAQVPGVAHPRRRLTTETIVENVEIFSVSDATRFSQATGDAERASTVCVQLSEEQLAAAMKAAEQGRVKLVVRDEQTELSAADASAPLAIVGNIGGAFEPPMNADFSFSGLSENTADDVSAQNASVPFEIAVETEDAVVPNVPVDETPAADASALLDVALEGEDSDLSEEETESDAVIQLREASASAEAAETDETDKAASEDDAEETKESDEEKAKESDEEPRQANIFSSSFGAEPYRASAVNPSVAEEARVEKASKAPVKKFKYVSPFATVNEKRTRKTVSAPQNN